MKTLRTLPSSNSKKELKPNLSKLPDYFNDEEMDMITFIRMVKKLEKSPVNNLYPV